MYALLIDTTGKYLQLELWQEQKLITSEFVLTKNDVSERLIPTVEKILKENNISLEDVKKIFLCEGPGSFTGIRIGMTVSKILATFGVEIYTFSSLQGLASNFLEEDKYIAPVIDARSKSAYAAIYKITNKKIEAVKNEAIYKLDELKETLENSKNKIDVITLDSKLLSGVENENIKIFCECEMLKVNLPNLKKFEMLKKVDNYNTLEPNYLKNV